MKRKLENIIIPESFAEHTPKNYKLAECKRYWDRNHLQDRYVVINRDNVLIDGYCMYLVLKHYGVEECQVKVSEIRQARFNRIDRTNQYRGIPTTYVYGVHNEDPDHKEYVWRLPRNWTDGEVCVGEQLVVDTRRGESVMTVTRFDILEQPPVNGTVKKVLRKA